MQLEESIDFVLRNTALFGDEFYRQFFEAVPAAKMYFDGVDMRRQGYVLTMGLTLIRQHREHRYRVTDDYLVYLGSKHFDRKIPVDLYNEWRRVMLSTLAVFLGPRWTPELETRWGEAIDGCIDAMMRGYVSHKST